MEKQVFIRLKPSCVNDGRLNPLMEQKPNSTRSTFTPFFRRNRIRPVIYHGFTRATTSPHAFPPPRWRKTVIIAMKMCCIRFVCTYRC